MKKSFIIVATVLLLGALTLTLAADNSNSQAGGLPALAARVQVLESQVANLINQVKKLTEEVENGNVLFSQRDNVTAFNFATGAGLQLGIVTGKVNGTSIVNFQFTPTSPTTFNFDNKVVITDLDGDQLRIRNQGTGQFITPIDPAVFSLGGPMVGTYEVIGGTGKFASWVGNKYPYRAVMSSPVGSLGSVYVEILSNPT